MAKKFGLPSIMLSGLDPDPNDPTIIGGGTGGNTTNPYPCTFDEWLNDFGEDYNFDGSINLTDYGIWWYQNLGGQSTWSEYHPDIPWDSSWEINP